jgi:hypothetical protein
MGIEYLGPLERRENYDPEVVRAALKYGIDPDLAVSVHRQEYNPDQWVSTAGARGPMQLMPGTARELGVDPDDPQQNIDGGVRYLGQMLKAFGGDQVLALAAYNAGPGRVKAGTLPIETRRYTRDVIYRAKKLRQAAPEIEYLGPLEEEAQEIEYLGPLEDYAGDLNAGIAEMKQMEPAGPPEPTFLQKASFPAPEQSPDEMALGVRGISNAVKEVGAGLGGALERLATPEEPARDVEDWLTRVLPQSAKKTAFQLNPLVVAYGMIKPFTDKVIEMATRNPEELASGKFANEWIDPILTNIEALSEFMGAPVGVYGLEKAREKWLSDPVGSAVALVSLFAGARSATRETLKPKKEIPKTEEPAPAERVKPEEPVVEEFGKIPEEPIAPVEEARPGEAETRPEEPEYLGPLDELEAEKQAWRDIYSEEMAGIKSDVYEVADLIRKSGISLDSLKDFDKPVRALGRAGLVGVVRKRGGLSLDVIAADYGYPSAEALYYDLLNYRAKERFEEAPFATDAMKQEIAPVPTPGSEGELVVRGIAPVPATAFPPIRNESSRSSMIKTLSRQLDLPIRTGRMAQKKQVVGIYKTKAQVARIRKANDFPTALHESAHHFERMLELPKEYPPEVQALAYEGAKDLNREGFAEFVRYYVTEPKKAMTEAPAFFREFEEKLKQFPDVGDLLVKLRENWAEYKAAPSTSKVMSVIQQDPAKKQRMTLNDLYANMVDEIAPIGRLAEAAEKLKGRKLRPSENPYMLAWMTRGWARKAEQYLKWGQFKINADINTHGVVEFVGPSLRDILRPVEQRGERHLLDALLVAKRAVADERILKGFDGVLSRGDFEQTIKELEPRFKDVAEQLYQYSDNLLRYVVDAGRMSEKTYDAIKEKNLFYAPLYRVMDTDPSVSGLSKRKFAELPEATKRLKGSSRDIYSPTQNIMQNTFAMINLAERARIGGALIRISEIEGMGKFIEKLPVKLKPQKMGEIEALSRMIDRLDSIVGSDAAASMASELGSTRETFRAIRDITQKIHDPKFMDEHGMEGIEELLEQHGLQWNDLASIDDIITTFRPNYKTKPNEVILYNRGEPEVYELDPGLYKALMGLDSESIGAVEKVLSYPAKWLRAGATLAPEFALRNPFRDQMTAYIMSKYGYKPGVDMVRGLFHILGKTEVYQRFNVSGAGHAALVSLDRDYLSKNMKELLASRSQQVINLVRNPLEAARAFSELAEEMTRVGEFARGLKQEGQTFDAMLLAGHSARDVTLDFSRIGLKTKGMNAITAFWGAGVQGVDRVVREFKTNPARATARSVASITIPSLALYWAQRDDKDYQEIPLWRRTLFWNVVTHNEDGSLKRIWSWPKPFDLGVLFGTLPEMALEYAYKNDSRGLDEAMKQLFSMTAPSVIPTAFIPPIEWFANKSWFFGRPLIPRGTEDLKANLQYGPHTSQAVRLLSDVISKIPFEPIADMGSPAKIENFIRGYAGGLGQHTLDAIDILLKKTGMVDAPPDPAMTLADVPGIRGFIQRMPTANARSIEEFYAAYGKAKQTRESAKQEAGIRGLGAFGVKTETPEALRQMETFAKALSMQRKMVSLIYENRTMPADKKREAMDAIYRNMIQTAQKGLGK